MSELFAWAGLHPRALIRQAVCQVMREHAGLDALLAGRVWPNRMEHWFHNEFPAAGVYTLQEVRVASDVRPEPQERRLTLAVELLAGALESVDDTLDALCRRSGPCCGWTPSAGPWAASWMPCCRIRCLSYAAGIRRTLCSPSSIPAPIWRLPWKGSSRWARLS